MADLDAHFAMPKPVRIGGRLAALTATLMLGACAQTGIEDTGLLSALMPASDAQTDAAAAPAPSDPLQATDYWGKRYSKNPRDLDAALAYSQNLRAIGQKSQALVVLQQASIIHGADKRLAADYGRLALELDQVSLAKKLLTLADDPANPDWRIILARGTALAKEGSYREAISFYERANALKPNHPSVLNNLALAYIMSGEAERGETMLRQASASGEEVDAKVRQNLALVLGLQGKYDEATKVGSVDLAADQAQSNTDLLKKMVKLDAKPMTAPAEVAPLAAAPVQVAQPAPAAPTSWASSVAKAAEPKPVLRSSTIEADSGATQPDAEAAALRTGWGVQLGAATSASDH